VIASLVTLLLSHHHQHRTPAWRGGCEKSSRRVVTEDFGESKVFARQENSVDGIANKNSKTMLFATHPGMVFGLFMLLFFAFNYLPGKIFSGFGTIQRIRQ
jgi:hypothetical protein